MSETDLLRRAAARMRELAHAATLWFPAEDHDGMDPVPWPSDAEFTDFDAELGPHLAAWSPTVALAVADWLDLVARLLDEGFDANAETNAALAVARTFLREEAADATP